MSDKRRVLLFGSTLFMAGVKVSLQAFRNMEITSLDEGGAHALQRICEDRPDVVVFDMSNGQPDFVLELAKCNPALVLIGVGPNQEHALVLSSFSPQVQSVQDLVQAINSSSSQARPSLIRQPLLNRLSHSVSCLAGRIRALPRRQQLMVAIVCIGLVVGLVLSHANPVGNAPLVGTVAGRDWIDQIGSSLLVFGMGIALGAFLLGFWLRGHQRR